mmetsp:Transcript_9569/g.28612  ORF Transcript_9569/g.28612 Transcript_9569/m.28612 type:complete len:272 (+) Transcript_9569:131-946(+)
MRISAAFALLAVVTDAFRRARAPLRRAATGPRAAAAADAAPKKRVLVPIADGTEEIEVVTVVDVLRRAGAEVVLASVEADDRTEVVCSRGVRIVADVNVRAVTGRAAEPWDLIAIPGGISGAETIRDSIRLHPSLEKHFKALRPIAGICAAPAVLFEPKGFLEGVACTAHPAFADDLGGSLEEYNPSVEARVVRDGHVITSRGPGTSMEWALCCVDALFGAEVAREVAGPMVVQPLEPAPRRPHEWRLEDALDDRRSPSVGRALERLKPSE